jgi:regulator of replication initiation timing
MNRRSNETLEEFKTKKVGDLKNLRNTLSCIVKQNHNLKKETERLKKKITAIAAQQTGGRDPRINDDERIELKLSPDHSDT